jgi:hypothetical protein
MEGGGGKEGKREGGGKREAGRMRPRGSATSGGTGCSSAFLLATMRMRLRSFPQPAFFVRVCLTVEMEEGVETLWREQGFAQGG